MYLFSVSSIFMIPIGSSSAVFVFCLFYFFLDLNIIFIANKESFGEHGLGLLAKWAYNTFLIELSEPVIF